MIIVYSTQRVRPELRPEGSVISNPSFFRGPNTSAQAVYLAEPYPAIRAAYERCGIPVHDLKSGSPVASDQEREPKPSFRSIKDYNAPPTDFNSISSESD